MSLTEIGGVMITKERKTRAIVTLVISSVVWLALFAAIFSPYIVAFFSPD